MNADPAALGLPLSGGQPAGQGRHAHMARGLWRPEDAFVRLADVAHQIPPTLLVLRSDYWTRGRLPGLEQHRRSR